MAFGPYAGGGGFAPAPMPFMTHLLNAVFNPAAVMAPASDSTFMSSPGARWATPTDTGDPGSNPATSSAGPDGPRQPGAAPSGAAMPGSADMIALLQSYSTNPNLQNLLKGYGTDPNVTNMIDQYGTDPTVAALLKQYGIGGGGSGLPTGPQTPSTNPTDYGTDPTPQKDAVTGESLTHAPTPPWMRPSATALPTPPYLNTAALHRFSPQFSQQFSPQQRRWGY